LTPREASLVSRTVFSYYRWFGWLEKSQPIHSALERALQLADQFATDPNTLSGSELIARAIPGWVKEQMEIKPEWMRSLQAEPKIWLRAQAGLGRSLASELGDCQSYESGLLQDALHYRGKSDLFRTAAFHAGRFEIHDLASQAIGLVCGPQAGEFWWDACAGEGGKTLHLSSLMQNQGLIWASDRAAWRLQKLKRRAARAKVFNYRAALWDGSAKLPTKTKFDGVLIDAPCMGLGTWHRNPHARWTTTAQDIVELNALQKQLLRNATTAVKKGGKLIYAVCTMTRGETVEVVQTFENDHPGFERLEVSNPLETSAKPVSELWLWPQQYGSNGMFAAAWVRR
jgi:16S rRNA (cytosine967-C5)-methyltransferase